MSNYDLPSQTSIGKMFECHPYENTDRTAVVVPTKLTGKDMHSITITYSYNQKNIMETSKELVNLNTNRERDVKKLYSSGIFL